MSKHIALPDRLSPEALGMFDDQDRKAITRSARKALARNSRRQTKAAQGFGGGFVVLPLKPRNENQAEYIDMLLNEEQVFAVGPAGVGKTYIAARVYMRMMLDKKIDGIMMARPSVSKPKHRLGFRPGNQDGKVEDWMVPIMHGFKAEVSASTLVSLKQQKRLEFLAFETLRGRSLERVGVILDEGQNCDFSDLKLFLTRQGEGSRVVVCGDLEQCDIPDSGLETVIAMIDDERLNIDASVIEFTDDDVVRSERVKQWVRAFRVYESAGSGD